MRDALIGALAYMHTYMYMYMYMHVCGYKYMHVHKQMENYKCTRTVDVKITFTLR